MDVERRRERDILESSRMSYRRCMSSGFGMPFGLIPWALLPQVEDDLKAEIKRLKAEGLAQKREMQADVEAQRKLVREEKEHWETKFKQADSNWCAPLHMSLAAPGLGCASVGLQASSCGMGPAHMGLGFVCRSQSQSPFSISIPASPITCLFTDRLGQGVSACSKSFCG